MNETSITGANKRRTTSRGGYFHWSKSIQAIGFGLAVMGLVAAPVQAATYYVQPAPNGSDSHTAAQAQNIGTPWATINHAASIAVAGDTVIIRAGDYREVVQPQHSGTASAPITYENYPGEIAVVDGTNLQSGTWTLESPNIYYTTYTNTVGNTDDQVFQNMGTATAPNWVMRSEARWPAPNADYPWQNSSIRPSPDWSYMGTYQGNAGSTGYNSSGQNGWFIDPNLPTRPNGYWNGCTVHAITGVGWDMEFSTITGYTDATKTITTNDAHGSNSYYAFTPGNEYYITGQKGELNQDGEWYYDAPDSRLYVYSDTGAPPTPTATSIPTGSFEAKARNQGFYLNNLSYITLQGLHFWGTTIKTTGCSYCTYNGLVMQYTNHSSQSSNFFALILRTGDVLRNSDISFDSFGLVDLEGDNIRVINNNLHDAAYIPTRGALLGGNISPPGAGTTAQRPWANELVSNNTLYTCGVHGMLFTNRASVIQYNDISDVKKLTSDGGGFYSISEGGNGVIQYNFVHDTSGPVGQTGATPTAIYFDSECSNWVVHHNIVWNFFETGRNLAAAICMNRQSNFMKAFNNSTWNCGPLAAGFTTDGKDGDTIYNNLFTSLPEGTPWANSDVRFNLYTDPLYQNPSDQNFQLQSGSPAIDQGVPIPGITTGYLGAAPDLGALESGGADWTSQVGYSATTPPSPDPTYNLPVYTFTNQIVDGSFENASSAWVLSGSAQFYWNGTSAWTNGLLRSGNRDVTFGAGTSEVNQTVNGLLPNHRYVFHAGLRIADPAATVNIGVRNFGGVAGTTVQTQIPPTSSAWEMNGQAFVTGPTTTSAQVFVDVTSPNGATEPTYTDDLAVQLEQAPIDGASSVMPILEYRLNQTSGSVATDSTPNAYNGAISGTPNWVPGVFGNALSFDGSTNYITSPAFASPAEVTVSCWAKSATSTWTSSSNFSMVSKRPSFMLNPGTVGGYNSIGFYIYSGGVRYGIRCELPASFDITKWHNYVGVYSPSLGQLSIYADGMLENQSAMSTALDSTVAPLNVGKDAGTGGTNDYFAGVIDDVRVYNYAMNANQIGAIYTADPTETLHYKFDDSAGTTQAWDCSGNYEWGTLNNMSSTSTWVTGEVNGAAYFPGFGGSNTYIVSPAMPAQTELTVACWAKSPTSAWNQDLCWVSKDSVNNSFALGPYSGGSKMRFGFTLAGGSSLQLAYTPPAGFDITQWHHYVGVFSSAANGLAQIYVDGVLQEQGTYNGTLNADTGPIYIGNFRVNNNGTPGNHYFNGTLDDVRVYSRALSALEIQNIFFQTSQPPYQ